MFHHHDGSKIPLKINSKFSVGFREIEKVMDRESERGRELEREKDRVDRSQQIKRPNLTISSFMKGLILQWEKGQILAKFLDKICLNM
jgi:hypothetical protein